jgi:glycosyltransferase involved in cell wall biosynthesis
VRIAVLHPSFANLGGAEVLAREQALELTALGHQVRIVSFALGRLAGSVGRDIELIELRRPFRRPEAPRVFFEAATGIERALRLVLSDVDRVIAHHPPASELAMRASAAERTILYCHEPPRSLYRELVSPRLHAFAREPGSEPSLAAAAHRRSLRIDARRALVPLGQSAFRREDRRAVQSLSAVWANSEFTRSLVGAVYGRSDAEVVPPFVSEPPMRRSARFRGDGPLRLLVRSRLQPIKNVDGVLRAVKLALEQGLDVELDVVGEGTARARLKQLGRELGLEARVRFHGFLKASESSEVSDTCHAFVLLPFDEPFGMVFVEAAFEGLAVLGPDSGGPVEVLSSGGFFARPEDPSSIAAGIAAIHAASNEELGERHARLTRHCVAHYTPRAFRERAAALLSKPI